MIYCIFACDKNGVIGINGRMPWHIKSELEFFREKTLGSTVIMGRKTYESMGKPLPGRDNIVVTSRELNGVKTAKSIDSAIRMSKTNDTYIIGGSRILNESFNICDGIYNSVVNVDLDIHTTDKVTKVNLSFRDYFVLGSFSDHGEFTTYYYKRFY